MLGGWEAARRLERDWPALARSLRVAAHAVTMADVEERNREAAAAADRPS